MAKKGLGRGLNALLSDDEPKVLPKEASLEGMVELKVMDIEPDKNQPRKAFDDEAIAELAEPNSSTEWAQTSKLTVSLPLCRVLNSSKALPSKQTTFVQAPQ